MTMLCVPIFVETAEQAKREALRAAEAGADLIEYRIDTFDPESDPGLVVNSPLPCIVTCRASFEGGRSTFSNRERLALLDSQLAVGASYADIELATYQQQLKDVPTSGRLIISAHDFTTRPHRLYAILDELNGVPGEVAKIVWMARSIRDNIEAFEILQHRQKPTIALCMGEAGLISRVLAKKFGAFLTFASLRDESATAPGQVTIHDMKRLYRWDKLQPSTKVYGVVGSPIAHSMSPAIHNGGFDAIDFDGVYLPLLVNPGYESFKAFMETFLAFAPLDLRGLSVTIPHKENALRYLKERGARIDALAERIGALNTITIEPGAPLRGFNTDYDAILDTITSSLNIARENLKDLRIAVIGAGGAGRTAVAALADAGAAVMIYNRTKDRADALAEEFNGHSGKVVSAPMEKLAGAGCDVLINATPIGMHPNVDASPISGHPPKFSADMLVFDTIYNPMETRLLREAKSAGAKTVGGIEMFVRQAAGQFQDWTRHPAPTDLFRRIIQARLNT